MDIVKLALRVLDFLRSLARIFEGAQQRQAGRDEANTDTLRQNAERVKQANEAEVEAQGDHARMPGDEAFDKTFRRG